MFSVVYVNPFGGTLVQLVTSPNMGPPPPPPPRYVKSCLLHIPFICRQAGSWHSMEMPSCFHVNSKPIPTLCVFSENVQRTRQIHVETIINRMAKT